MIKRIAEFLAIWEKTELSGFNVKQWVKEWMVYILKGGIRPGHPH